MFVYLLWLMFYSAIFVCILFKYLFAYGEFNSSEIIDVQCEEDLQHDGRIND